MLKDENGKTIFTADDAVAWLKDDLWRIKLNNEWFPEKTKRKQAYSDGKASGFEWAVELLEIHIKQFTERAEAGEEVPHV